MLQLRFVGTNYHGFQIQQNAVSVQSVLQDALIKTLGYRPDIKACSRTDAGVHANRFYVSLRLERPFGVAELPDALNNKLPGDVRVLYAREAPEAFHARYNCTKKRYVYKIYNDRVLDPFWLGRAMHLPMPVIDAPSLEQAAQVFVGRHDFRAFCGKKNTQDDTVRTIGEFTVARQGPLVTLAVSADGFLYNMVRILAGTLVNAARGKLSAGDIAQILHSRERTNLNITAPPEGLYLDEAWFDFKSAPERQRDDE